MRGKFIFHAGLSNRRPFFMAPGVALSHPGAIPNVADFLRPVCRQPLRSALQSANSPFLHHPGLHLQVLLLRKNFHLVQALQLIVGVIFGFFIDFSMYLTSWIRRLPGVNA